MATTATNKQPLLVDRPMHEICDLYGCTIAQNSQIDIGSSNKARVVLDCTQNDGAVVFEIYAFGRETAGNSGNTTPWVINLYMASSNDFLRPNDSLYVGFFSAGTGSTVTEGDRTVWGAMPYTLMPVRGAGSGTAGSKPLGAQFESLIVPKGKCLWAAVNEKVDGSSNPVDAGATTAPILGLSGGFY